MHSYAFKHNNNLHFPKLVNLVNFCRLVYLNFYTQCNYKTDKLGPMNIYTKDSTTNTRRLCLLVKTLLCTPRHGSSVQKRSAPQVTFSSTFTRAASHQFTPPDFNDWLVTLITFITSKGWWPTRSAESFSWVQSRLQPDSLLPDNLMTWMTNKLHTDMSTFSFSKMFFLRLKIRCSDKHRTQVHWTDDYREVHSSGI